MIWTIAWREIVTRVRTKPFQILTAIMFLGVIAVALGVSLYTVFEAAMQGVLVDYKLCAGIDNEQ